MQSPVSKPRLLTDVCDPDELYKPDMPLTFRSRYVYDPEIQRGTKNSSAGPKEFLRSSQIKSMKDDIMDNRFECPQLMWNLRAAQTCWVYIREKNELRIYQGVEIALFERRATFKRYASRV